MRLLEDLIIVIKLEVTWGRSADVNPIIISESTLPDHLGMSA